MGIEDREKAWDEAADRARADGKDYIIRSYPEFNAKFIACVVDGCNWSDYFPGSTNWEDHPSVQKAILSHTLEHRNQKG